METSDAQQRPPQAPTYDHVVADTGGRRPGEDLGRGPARATTGRLLATRILIVCAFVAGAAGLVVYRIETGLSLKLTFGALAAAAVVARWLFTLATRHRS